MDLSGGIGGATPVGAVISAAAAGTASIISAPASTLSMMDSWFGYTLVDPKAPTKNQTAYKSELHTICIVESILLGIVALYYGLDKTLLKNQL
jgi:hypothetical protein